MLTRVHNKSLRAIQTIIFTLWPATLWAAQITLADSLDQVPALAWLMVFILSTVSSLAALLNRLKIDTPPRLGVFMAAHMVGSWLAGVLVFFVGEALDMNDFLEVGAISLAAYAGAQLMDRWAVAFTNRVSGQTESGAYGPGTKP